ncbi:MAG: MFS transporter [Gammaproteobacteria bacterium]|nr:MFS transporter [Gammaproteobacteria bacterium]
MLPANRLQLLSYGLPGLPLAVLSLPLVVYLPTFYTQALGLSLLAVGGALLLARLFDVFSDVFIGELSDRASRRGISRKLVIACGVPVLLIGTSQLFQPTGTATFGSLLLWSLVAYLGWTLIAVPYYAWGAALSADGHRRTQLAGSREGFTILGVAAVIFVPALLGVSDQPTTVMRGVSDLLWWILPATVLIALWRVPDAPTSIAVKVVDAGAFAALRANVPMRRLLIAYTLSNVANALPATLFIFFISQVLDAADQVGLFLGIYFLAGIVALPFWILLSRRYGKVRSWAWSMLLATVAFAGAPWLEAGDLALYAVICLFTGLAYGADLALPASLQADMVDLDQHYSGQQRAGLLFGLWGLATKLAAALGVGLAFGALALVGFDPQTQNSATTLGLLALLYGLAPVLLKLVSIALIWRLPTTLSTSQDIATNPNQETHHVENPALSSAERQSADRLYQHAS